MRGPKKEKAVYSTCPYTAISRKVVGKSARDNPERYCGWFWVHSSTKKFERMAGEAMDICLRVLKESNKLVGSTVAMSGVVYWVYPILPYGIFACTFFPTTTLEIAVCLYVCSKPLLNLATVLVLRHSFQQGRKILENCSQSKDDKNVGLFNACQYQHNSWTV